MRRRIINELRAWKTSKQRMPLLVRGARQIGKSYNIREFGRSEFDHFIEINFELSPQYKTYFSDLDPNKIIQQLKLLKLGTIIPGKTLLFLDEIQECTQALMSLRYFHEMMPELHIIAAGSLLEFALKKEKFRMPVGRVEYRYMYPMSFQEFLIMTNHEELCQFLQEVTLESGIADGIHQHLLQLFRKYMILGGMPKVVATYLDTNDYPAAQGIQTQLLNTYRNDFGKYSTKKEIPLIEEIFYKSPGLLGQVFKYSHISTEFRSRGLKGALNHLIDANIVTPVYSCNAAGLPLQATVNYKKFKINYVDVGLAINAIGLSAELLLRQDFFAINRGSLMEQIVGQELLAYSLPIKPGELYFWSKDKPKSSAEIDYVMQIDDAVLPIEVKAGKTGRLKSLQVFMEEKSSSFGLRISHHPLAFEKNLLSIPAYMLSEITRLVTLLRRKLPNRR